MCSEFKSATQIFVNYIHIEVQLILKMTLFRIHGPDDQNRWYQKNYTKFFHKVIFVFWIQICNPNLCKSHIFWNTANFERWPSFAYADLMTEIDEIGKIARNSFIGGNLHSEFKSATQIYVNLMHCEIQLILRNDLVSQTRTWWPKSMKSEKIAKNCFIL